VDIPSEAVAGALALAVVLDARGAWLWLHTLGGRVPRATGLRAQPIAAGVFGFALGTVVGTAIPTFASLALIVWASSSSSLLAASVPLAVFGLGRAMPVIAACALYQQGRPAGAPVVLAFTWIQGVFAPLATAVALGAALALA